MRQHAAERRRGAPREDIMGLKTLVASVGHATLATLGLAGVAAAQDKSIIFLAGPSSDPFWGAVQQGFDTAVKELGVDAQFSAPPDFNDIVPNYTKLFEAAIGRKPGAIVVGDFFPDPTDPLIKQAVADGIAVIVYNSGRDGYRDLGATTFIGEDSYLMGKRGGERAAKAGVKSGICINQIAANPVLEQRCKGYIDGVIAGGGQAKMVALPSEDIGNDQKVTASIAALLQADSAIDGIMTLGAAPSLDAIAAGKQFADRKFFIGTLDLSTPVLEAIKAGDLAFTMDQQPFLQGYYGVLMAHQFLEYGLAPAEPITTGPLVIDQSNVDKVLSVGKEHPGVRGAS
jgi:simple sugar transport system substrate-binding protein